MDTIEMKLNRSSDIHEKHIRRVASEAHMKNEIIMNKIIEQR